MGLRVIKFIMRLMKLTITISLMLPISPMSLNSLINSMLLMSFMSLVSLLIYVLIPAKRPTEFVAHTVGLDLLS